MISGEEIVPVEAHPDAGCRDGFTTCMTCYGRGTYKDDKTEEWDVCPVCKGATEVPNKY